MKRGPKPGINPSKDAIYKRMQRRAALLSDNPGLLKEFDNFGQIWHDHFSDWLLLRNPRMYERVDKKFLETMAKQVAIRSEADKRIEEINREAEARIAALWDDDHDGVDNFEN